MEASGHGLAVDEFVSYQRASTVLLMSLKEMVSNGKPKTSLKGKIQLRIVDFLSLHNINAVFWLPALVCLRSLILVQKMF